MKKDKRYYVELVEEFGKKVVKDKNNIGSYFDTQLKKECGCASLCWSTTDDKIEIGIHIRRKD